MLSVFAFRMGGVLGASLFAFGHAQLLSAQTSITEDVTAAVMASDLETVQSLIKELGFSINERLEDQYALLHLAAMVGDPIIVQALLEADGEINAVDGVNGWTPLMHATYNGHEGVVQLLLERNADRGITGTDMSTAAILARFSGLSSLFEEAAKSDFESSTPDQARLDDLLLRATEVGDRSLVEALLEQGANPSTMSDAGWTPLLYSALRHDVFLFRSLRERGASVMLDQQVSLTEAALIGATANSSSYRVRRFIEYLVSIGETHDLNRYRQLAIQLDLEENITLLFGREPRRPDELAFLIKPEMERADWLEIQHILKDLTLYQGSLDGIPGPATRRGVYAYYRHAFDELRAELVDFCSEGERAYLGWPKAAAEQELDPLLYLRGTDTVWNYKVEIDDFASEGFYLTALAGNHGITLFSVESFPLEQWPDEHGGFSCRYSVAGFSSLNAAVYFPGRIAIVLQDRVDSTGTPRDRYTMIGNFPLPNSYRAFAIDLDRRIYWSEVQAADAIREDYYGSSRYIWGSF